VLARWSTLSSRVVVLAAENKRVVVAQVVFA
jgi:hypothetical protein